MFLLPPPKAYIDWTVPRDKEGNDIGVCNQLDVNYYYYLDWLADYLYTTEIPVPDCQLALLEKYKEKGADHAMLDLSDLIGYGQYTIEQIEWEYSDGIPFSERQKAERLAWEELSREEQAEWTEEDFFTLPEEYERIVKELQQSKIVPAHIQHIDVPYRPIIATLFKDIPDQLMRRKLIYFFYKNYSECASK